MLQALRMPPAANPWMPTVAASNARRVQRFGVSRGLDPSRLGAVSDADEPGARVPARRMFEIWTTLAGALDRSVPIQLAQRSSIEDLQLLGFTLTTAPTVRDALSAFERFSPLLSDAFRWSLRCEGPVLEVRWHCRVPRDPGVCLALETSIAQFVNGVRQLAGVDVDPVLVNIAHAAPATTRLHAAFFRCRVDFAAGCDRILFRRHVTEVVPPQANRALWSYLCGQAERALGGLSPRPLSERVRSEIADCLVQGRSPRLSDLSDRLGTSERSLRRQLADHSLSFRKLVDDERHRRARELLARPDVSISRAALDLGFADGSALAHACQRWFSRTPGELKRATTETRSPRPRSRNSRKR
jgi:AraC-like DNA-binding protein